MKNRLERTFYGSGLNGYFLEASPCLRHALPASALWRRSCANIFPCHSSGDSKAHRFNSGQSALDGISAFGGDLSGMNGHTLLVAPLIAMSVGELFTQGKRNVFGDAGEPENFCG